MSLSVDDFSELFGSAAALISTGFYPTCLQYMEKSKKSEVVSYDLLVVFCSGWFCWIASRHQVKA